MKVHPQVQRYLDNPELSVVGPDSEAPPAIGVVRDLVIAVAGGEIPVRVYRPASGEGSLERPSPLLVWFHGGGWVRGDIESADGAVRHIVEESGCVAISVGYRLAPQFRFPIPAEDCYAAFIWAHQNAASMGGDADRLAVGGSSAGGNLAAVVAQMGRDRGGPRIKSQVLVYPVIQADFSTRSYLANADGLHLTRDMMMSFWKQYLTSESDANNPYAAPILGDLRNLPPARVHTAEFDPLCDEGEAYHDKLVRSGGKSVLIRHAGMVHGFFNHWRIIDHGRLALRGIGRDLKTDLSSDPS